MSMGCCTQTAHFRDQGHLENGAIHTLPGLVSGETLLFASALFKNEAGPRLIHRLLTALGRIDPRWHSTIDENAFTLHKTALGDPYLLLGNQLGPPLSYSHGDGQLWAVVASQWCIGIDVAYAEDFAGNYPFERVFRPEELEFTRTLGHKNTAQAAALLWSLKEASVKAAGTGFNYYDPRDVRVGSPRISDRGMLFDVWAGGSISAWARVEGRGWLAVASARRRFDPRASRPSAAETNR